jgi:hypothetical protein
MTAQSPSAFPEAAKPHDRAHGKNHPGMETSSHTLPVVKSASRCLVVSLHFPAHTEFLNDPVKKVS